MVIDRDLTEECRRREERDERLVVVGEGYGDTGVPDLERLDLAPELLVVVARQVVDLAQAPVVVVVRRVRARVQRQDDG